VATTRALVLAGGGVTGIAWELGVLLGLQDAGVDAVGAASLVVGTSAGSAVGAQVLSGVPLTSVYERQLEATHQELTPDLDFDGLVAIFGELAGGDRHDPALLRRLGAMALAATTVPEAERRAVIEARLPVHAWPAAPRLLITAIDVVTGELVVFDRSSGVGLVDAVAASCAVPGVWPPVTIGDRRFMDGGVRSTANADLAGDAERVLVLAPMSGPTVAELDAEVAVLPGRVLTVTADDEAAQAMGPNPLDPSRRADAARTGRRQGAAVAASVRELLE
jgi:NTE family protein